MIETEREKGRDRDHIYKVIVLRFFFIRFSNHTNLILRLFNSTNTQTRAKCNECINCRNRKIIKFMRHVLWWNAKWEEKENEHRSRTHPKWIRLRVCNVSICFAFKLAWFCHELFVRQQQQQQQQKEAKKEDWIKT